METLKNPHGLTGQQVELLSTYFAGLSELDRALSARVLRYLVDGEEPEVILALTALPRTAEVLYLTQPKVPQDWGKFQVAMRDRGLIWRTPKPLPSPVAYRFARTLDACLSPHAVQSLAMQGLPSWAATLLQDIVQIATMEIRTARSADRWKIQDVEGILTAGDASGAALAMAFLDGAIARGLYGPHAPYEGVVVMIAQIFTGWSEFWRSHMREIREALRAGDAERRAHVLQLVKSSGAELGEIVDLLVEMATGTSKTVRELAVGLLSGHQDAAFGLLEQVLASGDAAARNEAAVVLGRLYGERAGSVLARHLETETANRVRQTIEKMRAAPVDAGSIAVLPPVRIETGVVPLSDRVREAIRQYLGDMRQASLQFHAMLLERHKALANNAPAISIKEPPAELPAATLENLFAFLEGKCAAPGEFQKAFAHYPPHFKPFGSWLTPPDAQLIHVVRLAFAFRQVPAIIAGNVLFWLSFIQDLESYRARCAEPFGLRELIAAVRAVPGGHAESVLVAYLGFNNRHQTFCDWEPEYIWPAFAEAPEVLTRALTEPASVGDFHWAARRRNAFRVLSFFPTLPAGFIPVLWELALGDAKAERVKAQAALKSVPDKTARVVVALADGKQSVRQAAAEWLGEIGDCSAVPALVAAARKEKQENVKANLLTALEALGASVEEFLDRGALQKQAVAGAGKKLPKGAEWVERLKPPPLSWADTGERVDESIISWWICQSVQQKSPACGPLLRRHLAQCRKTEAIGLARYLLSAWVAQDTRALSHEEAAELARKEADATWARFGQHPAWLEMYKGDKENLYKSLYQRHSTNCLGSAIDQKGILALVAAAGDADCVKVCEHYIRQWYGNRVAQCRALVEVLAWIQHPLAVQTLLSIANRFRTKTIRETAAEMVQMLADREGWTLDELADRTIPDAGFERPLGPDGLTIGGESTLVLDYGARRFNVQLDEELQPVIRTEDGKVLSSAPEPLKADDAELAKAAKKLFSEAKKTVKETVKRQTERLYEGVCTQRRWRFDEWQRYLLAHPIVGRLCGRLVWAAFTPGENSEYLGAFRPLSDGSFTNELDEAVTYPPETVVAVAHPCNTPPAVSTAWDQHLKDYKVSPLFPQFGRPVYRLDESRRTDTELSEFEGHMVRTFKLRQKATKLGYLRGEAEDGGCFFLYRKNFPSLKLSAVIGFSGNQLPEEDIPAFLHQLYFTTLSDGRDGSRGASKVPLGRLPTVLLSECYNDLAQIAAEGTGFDPDWAKKGLA
jgi:hypothetical protein